MLCRSVWTVFSLLCHESHTSSMYSGSLAEASQRLFKTKMLGLESRSFTLWKKDFSFKSQKTDQM